MNSKHFLINPYSKPSSKEAIDYIEKSNAEILKKGYDNNRQLTQKRLNEEVVNLKHVQDRIIIKIDLDGKDIHTFDSGVQIYRGRRFNELNRRITEPVNAFVVDAEYISKDSEILIHPNSICDANKIFDYGDAAIEENNAVRYYSIEEISAFLFREGDRWKPLKNFAIGLRVYKQYKGLIQGIAPEQIKDVLYIQSGEYTNKVVQTLRSCDYELIFQGVNGREDRIIRCRHYEGYDHDREEIIVERNDLTEQVNQKKLLIGIDPNNAKFISE